jgi:Fic family protein
MPAYLPPFQITTRVLGRVAEICEALGRLSISNSQTLSPRLRRDNRIRTIHASLAIESNTLSLEQVTAVFNGERVLGLPREIQEVRNAILAYEQLGHWLPDQRADMLRAHQLLMTGLVDRPGYWREGGVGIYRGEALVHMPPPANRVNSLIDDLLAWLRSTDVHPLIASCIFHYEFEFIHPFDDGNGRMGRLWQTLILSRWQPLLAYLPVETLIHARQQAYYQALSHSDQLAEATPFIEFMLDALGDAIRDLGAADVASGSEISSEISSEIIPNQVLALLSAEPRLSAAALAARVGISSRAVEKHLARLREQGRIRRHGSPRAGRWEVL